MFKYTGTCTYRYNYSSTITLCKKIISQLDAELGCSMRMMMLLFRNLQEHQHKDFVYQKEVPSEY